MHRSDYDSTTQLARARKRYGRACSIGCGVLGAAILAAAMVYFFDWLYADPVLALLIIVILGRGAYRVLKESTHILLEGVPHNVRAGARRMRRPVLGGTSGPSGPISQHSLVGG